MPTEQEHREAITESQFREYAEFDYDFGKFEEIITIERIGSEPETWEVTGTVNIDRLPAELKALAAEIAPVDGYLLIQDVVVWDDFANAGYEIAKTLIQADPRVAGSRS